jgi:hypothetical protein
MYRMTTGKWKGGGAHHRLFSAAAGTAAAIEIASLGAAREGVSGSVSMRAAPREAT